jgi:tRNA (cytidine/uridine-2'-O-)-methyltransferase
MTDAINHNNAEQEGLCLPDKLPVVVVLIEPEIPANTGNITRLCACTGVPLYLVGRLGFRLDDKLLDRSAMDYKQLVQPQHYDSFEAVQALYPDYMPVFLSSKAMQSHFDMNYRALGAGVLLVFGPETRGLPEALLNRYPQQSVRIPMVAAGRSLNLSNAVSIVLYQALQSLMQ